MPRYNTRRTLLAVAVAGTLGCPSARTTPDRPGAPPSPETTPIIRSPGRWTLEREPGTARYLIRNSATIALAGDTTPPDSLATTLIVSVILSGARDGLTVAGTIDSLRVERGARIATSDTTLSLPIGLQGVLDRQGGVVELRSTVATDSTCGTSLDPVIAMTRDVFVRLPSRLTSGMTWEDTTRSTSCRGRIPVATTTIATYSVLGEQATERQRMLAVRRTTVLRMEGSGDQVGRAATVNGSGSGSGTFLIDPESAELVEGRSESTITVTFEAGMLRQTFTQQGTQEIRRHSGALR